MNDEAQKKRLFRLMLFLFIVCFAYFGAVTFLPLPETGIKYADMIVPFLLGTAVGTMITYNWGGSAGSSEKNALMAKMSGRGPTSVGPPDTVAATTSTVKENGVSCPGEKKII